MNFLKSKFFVAICLCLVCVFAFTGCGVDEIDISSYADKTLTIKGATDKPIVLTIEELKAMNPKTIKAESTSDKIGELRVTGVWLSDLLAKYDCKASDFSKLIIVGSDEYDAKLMQDYLAEHDIMLAYGEGGKPLDAESAPLRLIIKDSDSAYWVRMVTELQFVK